MFTNVVAVPTLMGRIRVARPRRRKHAAYLWLDKDAVGVCKRDANSVFAFYFLWTQRQFDHKRHHWTYSWEIRRSDRIKISAQNSQQTVICNFSGVGENCEI